MNAETSRHLTDEEATLLGDGQPIGAAELQHVEACDACAARVAELALGSLALHRDLLALADAPATAEPARSSARPPRPVRVIQPGAAKPLLIGIAVALAASIPIIPSTTRTLSVLAAGRDAHLEAIGSTVRDVWADSNNPAWSFGTTAALLAVAVLLAVVASRRAQAQNTQGEARS